MSGAELLGVIAAAIQLAECGLSIATSFSDVTQRRLGASERMREHETKKEHLILAARLLNEQRRFMSRLYSLISIIFSAKHVHYAVSFARL